MGPLQPRTTSVSITTFIATTVVLFLWLLATVAVALHLFFRQRIRAQRAQRSSSFNRSASYGHTAPPFPPNGPTALPSYPQRAQAPPNPSIGPSSLSSTTRHSDLHPVHTTSRNIDPVPPWAPSRIEPSGRITTVSPIKKPTPAASFTNEATHRPLPTHNPAQAALLARLQAMPLASDTTELSSDTIYPEREVVNAGYLAMLTQRGVPLRDHALLGSDDSTDAGGGTYTALSYAVRAGGMGPSVGAVEPGRNGGRFAANGGRGRAITLGQEGAEEDVERVVPLQVRKMRSV